VVLKFYRKLKMYFPNKLVFILVVLWSCGGQDTITDSYDVVVLGAGTGAVSAAIQSARNGSRTLYVNPLEWHGGMLTAAGVSATDGNHNLPSGLWAEWRSLLRNYYGGADSLFTGWVSNTMFEPHVGHQLWVDLLAKEKNLTIYTSTEWDNISKIEKGWILRLRQLDAYVEAKILIDGTDLGDVAAAVGVKYDIGMDARSYSQESIAPEVANDIVQDMTYVAILKDYGPGMNKTITKPLDYDSSRYHCACQHDCNKEGIHPCKTMLDYGRLPNDKYMINWPINGNDYNANIIAQDKTVRQAVYEKAKKQTLGFVYYIQTELGYTHLGLAEDEFPTRDKLALIPYHREGRRIKGVTRFNLNHIIDPFNYQLYRTGIAVGDYPVDHHNHKSIDPPIIEFPNIPSFNIPAGSLIPESVEDLVIADKAISVSNIVNGCTRLQPSILQVGQAAGMIASIAAQQSISPREVDVRAVQSKLLDSNVFLMPYQDVVLDDLGFKSIQKIGATGILRGEGIPYKWANKTLFYSDSIVSVPDLLDDLIDYDEKLDKVAIGQVQSLNKVNVIDMVQQISYLLQIPLNQIDTSKVSDKITRRELAIILDKNLDLFGKQKIDLEGKKIN